MKIKYENVIRALVIFTTLCSLFVTWKTYSFFLSEKKDSIRAHKFQLVDNKNVIRAELSINKYNSAELSMYDETGNDMLLNIHASHYGTEVLLTNNINHGIITLTVSMNGNTAIQISPFEGDSLRIGN